MSDEDRFHGIISDNDEARLIDWLKTCDLNFTNRRRLTPLHFTCVLDFPRATETILERSRQLVNEPDSFGFTPLHYACSGSFEQTTIVEILLAYDAALDTTNLEGQTPIQLAARHGHFHVVKNLLQHWAIREGLCTELTDLHRAVGLRSLEVVRLLLQYPTEVDQISKKDPAGRTALHLAIEMGCTNIALVLIDVLLSHQIPIEPIGNDWENDSERAEEYGRRMIENGLRREDIVADIRRDSYLQKY